MIVLKYVVNKTGVRRFVTFIVNRVSAIRQESTPEQWHHVRSKFKPADYPPRGIQPSEPDKLKRWKRGPEFRWKSTHEWPVQPITKPSSKKPLNRPSQFDFRFRTIFVCNIRSVAPKIDELECMVNQNDLDNVFITETWLSNEIPSTAIAMNGFTLFRKDRGKRGGVLQYLLNLTFDVKD